jgi:formylglycine-generating enzyme required for sulfatase activity
LLTEAEWEKAASWEEGEERAGLLGLVDRRGRKRRYPWGDEFDKTRCNTSESGIGSTTPVGKYSPRGDSPYGCADMAGNVWEWTSSLLKPYPYNPSDGREDPNSEEDRVVRGGSKNDVADNSRSWLRYTVGPKEDRRSVGFRLVYPVP